MRKLYMTAAFLFAAASLQAAEGDTIRVSAHDATELGWYQYYDAPIAFPPDTLSYRKVVMEFVLGKHACPGYNPGNPGEGPGQTGWCSDWDYDVHVVAATPGGDTIELGRLVTPYANSNFPRTPFNWKHSYFFDVTDYYPVLTGDATIRIFYAGYSGGFTGTVRFHFIEGTPPRNVLKIDQLWRGSYRYGDANDPIDSAIGEKQLVMPAAAKSAEMKMIVTGHGNDAQGCSEFCKRWYRFLVNGNMVDQTLIWRDDCGDNFLYPQSGTWVYDRGNWCPGDLVHTNSHRVPAATTATDSNFTVRLQFQAHNSTQSETLYKVSTYMVYYDSFNHAVDAGIEEIIRPNKEETYYRSNPICGQPEVTVKNYGKEAITSIEFSYGIEGEPRLSHTWTGSLASLSTASIELPAIPELDTLGSQKTFVAEILKVNGNDDGDSHNNTMRTQFLPAPKWEGGNFAVQLKMSGSIQGFVNKVNWKIRDLGGAVLYSRNGTASSQTYNDTIHLDDGCYLLEVNSSDIGYGLSFFNAFSPKGTFRIVNLINNSRIALPKTDLGNPSLEGNFGNGFSQQFTVFNSQPSSIREQAADAFQSHVYPNPADGYVMIDLATSPTKPTNISIFNSLGQRVSQFESRESSIRIATGNLAPGIYTFILENDGRRKVEKVVISR